MTRRLLIYIPLLDEGTEVSRPAEAEWLGGNRYRIIGDVPADEVWAFQPGAIVIAEKENGALRAIADEGGDEEFWAEHDPYGERFGTRSPMLSCVGIVLLFAAVSFVAFKLL